MKSKGVTTQMKALDEYFLMVVVMVLLNTVHVFANVMLIWTEKHGNERVKSSSSSFLGPHSEIILQVRESVILDGVNQQKSLLHKMYMQQRPLWPDDFLKLLQVKTWTTVYVILKILKKNVKVYRNQLERHENV